MTYPGDVASWQAERSVSATIPGLAAVAAGRLRRRPPDVRPGRPRQGDVTAVATFENGLPPYAARLVLRDPGRTLGPYIERVRAAKGLAAKVAPRNASLVFAAETREEAPLTLLPTGAKTGLSFRFPSAVADAISQLDPREAVTVEFAFAGGRGDDVTRKAFVEVGDFAAGRAFLR
jgi:hypothetical protein